MNLVSPSAWQNFGRTINAVTKFWLSRKIALWQVSGYHEHGESIGNSPSCCPLRNRPRTLPQLGASTNRPSKQSGDITRISSHHSYKFILTLGCSLPRHRPARDAAIDPSHPTVSTWRKCHKCKRKKHLFPTFAPLSSNSNSTMLIV